MASIKLEYAASAAITISLASLASDSSLLAGRASTSVDNATNKYIDFLLAGKIRAGTSPTAGKIIEIWAYASLDDTPTYPDSITGTDAAKTMTSANVKYSALKLASSIQVDSTSARDYFFGPVSVAQLFGGAIPKKWGVFVVHDSAVALDATAGNHVISYTPVYATVV